jgi:6-pyruvoyltetrahydropterin/6-carboxytetrahydropterin synthase
MKRAALTRVFRFSAAHRLHSPFLDAEANRDLYRDCNNPGGHGHNYVLEVTLKGAVAPRSGMLVDLPLFERIVHERVLLRLDHQFIGVHEFGPEPRPDAFISTSEVVTAMIWSWLEGAFPEGVKLSRIRLQETHNNFFEYQGEDALAPQQGDLA